MTVYLILCTITWLLSWQIAHFLLFPRGVIAINPIEALKVRVLSSTAIAAPWWLIFGGIWFLRAVL